MSYFIILFKKNPWSDSDMPELEVRRLLSIADLRYDVSEGEVVVFCDFPSARVLGRVTVQSRVLIMVGRPVMSMSMLSSVIRANQL